MLWRVGPSSTPVHLDEALLLAHGLEPDQSIGMAMDLGYDNE
jgi:hypothetical protein